jgi:transposase
MRFVPVKSAAQQAALLHHRVRDLLVRQRTMQINALRGHFAEFGIIAPVGRHRVVDLINLLQDVDDADMPALAREVLRSIVAVLQALDVRIEAVEAMIVREHRTNAVSRRLASIPGIGPIAASTIAAPSPILRYSGQARTGGMDRLGSAPALKRGQTAARARVQARRPLSETLAHHWRDLGDATIARQDGRALGLGQSVVGSPSVPLGLVGAGEQDGADRLGGHGAVRGL